MVADRKTAKFTMALVFYLAGVACAELSMYGTYLAVEMARGGGALNRILFLLKFNEQVTFAFSKDIINYHVLQSLN